MENVDTYLDIINQQVKEISKLKQALSDIVTLTKLPEDKTIREIAVNAIGEEG